MFKKIKFSNYKPFEEEQEFEIRPITIVFGKNNSGKSALCRLPILLSRASGNRKIYKPIEWDYEDLKFGTEFRDLVYNKIETRPLHFEMELSNGSNIAVTIQYLTEERVPIITDYSIRLADSFSVQLKNTNTKDDRRQVYQFTDVNNNQGSITRLLRVM